MEINELVGKSHVFADGDSLTIMQVKRRSEDPVDCLVTYHVQQGPGIPRKLVLPLNEFIGTYGHLFGIDEPPQVPTE